MGEIRWTADQVRAIETVGRRVLVSAAAGSGKTAVLAHRCVYLLCDAPAEFLCHVDELLVVTFTEASAAEMKDRIRDILLERRLADPRNERVRNALAQLPTAQISTIHAFCRALLMRWFHVADVDPAAVLMDGDQSRILKSRVLEEVFSARYDDGAGRDDDGAGVGDEDDADDGGACFRSLVDLYGLGQDRPVGSFVLKLAGFLESLPDANAWLDDALKRVTTDTDATICEAFSGLIVELQMQAESACDLLRGFQPESAHGEFYAEAIAHHAEMLDWWASSLDEACQSLSLAGDSADGGASAVDALLVGMREHALTFRGVPRGKEATPEYILTGATALKKRYETRVAKRLAAFSVSELREGMRTVAPHVSSLIDLTRAFRERYADAKRRRDVLDFSDLESRAYRLLQDESVASVVRGEFAYVLVDEFQDVNPLQAAILRGVCRRSEGDMPGVGAPDGDASDGDAPSMNLFTVGDVKQCIYQFRSAEPQLFLDEIEACRDGDSRRTAIHLRENFRSRPEILAGVNAVFSRLLTPQLGGFAYDDTHALYAGLEAYGGNRASIDIHLVETPQHNRNMVQSEDDGDGEAEGFVDPDDPSMWESVRREAALIAREIRGLIAADTVVDGRPMRLSDVAVLLRVTRHTAQEIAGILQEYGIDAHTDAAGKLFDTIEIRTLRAALDVIDNPQQDIPLASVLRSGIFGRTFSDEDLACIRLAYPRVAFHLAVKAYADAGVDDDLRERLAEFWLTVARQQEIFRRCSLADALWQCVEGGGYLAKLLAQENGLQRRNNVIRFHGHARSFTEHRRVGLRRFLEYLDDLQDQKIDLATPSAVGEHAEAVRILSIHKAKGLEFPFVFVAQIGKRFNFDDAKGLMLFDREKGLGLRVVDKDRFVAYPTVGHRLVAENIDLRARAEELRILYVAMTRAKHRLWLVGSADLEKVSDRIDGCIRGPVVPTLVLRSANNLLDWLIPALGSMGIGEVDLFGSDSGSDSVTGEAGGDIPLFRLFRHDADAMGGWRKTGSPGRDVSATMLSVARLEPLPEQEPLPIDPSPAEAVLERIHTDYAHLAASSLPSVMAASDTKRVYDATRVADAVSTGEIAGRVGRADGGVSARDAGAVTHKVMQLIDFEHAIKTGGVGLEMERLVSSGVLTAEEAEAVDADAIAWFLDTPLGRSARDAGSRYHREFMFIAAHDASNFDPAIVDESEPVLVRGIADGVLESDDAIHIIDFKTDRIDAGEVSNRTLKHERQISLYAASLSGVFQKRASAASLVYLWPRVIHDVPLSSRDGPLPSDMER